MKNSLHKATAIFLRLGRAVLGNYSNRKNWDKSGATALKRRALLLAVIGICLTSPCFAILDSTDYVQYVGYLNSDCLQDTIVSRQSTNGNYIPVAIIWGKRLSTTQNICVDSTNYVADSLKVSTTNITYPAWERLRVTIAVSAFNPEDTLSDMIFFVSGVANVNGTLQDTSAQYLVYGQKNIITIPTIATATLPNYQTSPYLARRLRAGYEWQEPAEQNINGYTIQILTLPTEQNLAKTGNREEEITSGEKRQAQFKVFPNPSDQAITVRGEGMSRGDYAFELISQAGKTAMGVQKQVADAKGAIEFSIETRELPSGYYILRITGKENTTSIPITIIH